MTSLSKLPVELILHICYFIHPRQSVRATFHPDCSMDEGFYNIQASWHDLSNLSKTSHLYRAIIAESRLLYRTICVTGKLSQVVAFLKLIKSRPDIAASIHRLFLYHQWIFDCSEKNWFVNYFKPAKEHLSLIDYINQTVWELCDSPSPETRGEIGLSKSNDISDRQRALVKGILLHLQSLRRQDHISLSRYESFPSSDFPAVPFLNSVTLVIKPLRQYPQLPETRVVTYCILDERQLMETLRESRQDASNSLH